GRNLITGSMDRTVRVWDVSNGQTRTTLQAHTAGVTAVAIAPDGLQIASGGEDRTVRLWKAVPPLSPQVRRQYFDAMPGLAGSFQVFRVEKNGRVPVGLYPNPLFRYHNSNQGIHAGSLWAWGHQGRPVALLALELQQRPGGKTVWLH